MLRLMSSDYRIGTSNPSYNTNTGFT
jgi:hypothetical protein